MRIIYISMFNFLNIGRSLDDDDDDEAPSDKKPKTEIPTGVGTMLPPPAMPGMMPGQMIPGMPPRPGMIPPPNARMMHGAIPSMMGMRAMPPMGRCNFF